MLSASSAGTATVRDAIGERRPFDELHDERRRAVTALETIYMSDVRVIERREHFGFALKAREPIGVARERLPAGP